MRVEGPSPFPVGQMVTLQKSELLPGLALGGTTGRKAMDRVNTAAEIL